MLKFLKASVKFLPAVVLVSFIVAAILNPLWLSFLVLGIVLLLFYGLFKFLSIGPVPNMKPNPPDDDDSLEDDIRHHNYGYPGFGTVDDERD